MTQAATKWRNTVEDYLRLEQHSELKHEYDDGEIVAMAGGSPEHALIALNVGAEIRTRRKGGPCKAYSADLRIRLWGRPRYVYPDAAVICGEVRRDPDDAAGHSAMNPRLVVEVLSPTTEEYDRTRKFDRYRAIESFREYVLVAQHSARVETFFQKPDGSWQFDVVTGLDGVARLRSLDIDLPLAEVYAGVDFPPPPPDPDEVAAAATPS